LTYCPSWKGAFEAYAYKFSAAQHWRVKHVLDDPDDALQECAVIFCKICRVYGDAVDNPRWLMALFKRALARHFHSLARVNKRRAANLAAARDLAAAGPASEEPAHLRMLLSRASVELQEVLRTIDIAPRDLLDLLLPMKQTRFTPASEQRISRSWCRLARVGNVREDLVTELRGLLA
jgi:hypothetical protein